MNIDRGMIGSRIARRRKAKGLTQEELAKQLGLSKNQVSNMERGKNLPTTVCLIQLCDILGETPNYYLLGKCSGEPSKIIELLHRLPEDSQELTCRIIESCLALAQSQS